MRVSRGGFTLAEVAVTIAIVAITVLACYQGLDGSMLTAAHTRNMKLARDLGLVTLGQIEAGLYWEEIDEDGMEGSYAEEGYPQFFYEVALGDTTFIDVEQEPNQRFDNWAYLEEVRRERELQEEDEDLDSVEAVREELEEVRVRVTFPSMREFSNQVVLEQWIPWEQVYGPDLDREMSDGTEEPSDG